MVTSVTCRCNISIHSRTGERAGRFAMPPDETPTGIVLPVPRKGEYRDFGDTERERATISVGAATTCVVLAGGLVTLPTDSVSSIRASLAGCDIVFKFSPFSQIQMAAPTLQPRNTLLPTSTVRVCNQFTSPHSQVELEVLFEHSTQFSNE